MKARCYFPSQKSYRDYGARGVRVCDEWRHDFVAFMRDMGPCPRGHTIDRIDSVGHYEPGNCRWIPRFRQGESRRGHRMLTHAGRTQYLAQWAREIGVTDATLAKRLVRGWTLHDMLP